MKQNKFDKGVLIYDDDLKFINDLNMNLNNKRIIKINPEIFEKDLCELHSYDFYCKYCEGVGKIIFE